MEVKQINQLMLAMGRYGVKRLQIKREGVEIEIEREEKAPIRSFEPIGEADENPMRGDFEKHRSTGVVALSEQARSSAKASAIEEEKESEATVFVTSPMVGTLYHAPSPTDPPFVKVGDKVEKNTVVCIIEAMKVMNEVKALSAGIVAEILVESGHPVEFGTKLFRIIPA